MKLYLYVVSGWMRYDDEKCAPLTAEIIRPKIITDKDYRGLKAYICRLFKLKDFMMVNFIRLEHTTTEEELAVYRAEGIIKDQDCTPPEKEKL